jgi:hypothetical protein
MAPKVTPVIDAPKVSGRHLGVAPAIRRMKDRFPDLSEARIAKRVGCDPANVHRVLKRYLGNQITEEDHKVFQENQADVLSRVKHRFVKSITDDDIAKASLLQRVTAFGIIHDKEQVLLGRATSIEVTVLLDAVQAVRDLRDRE